MDPRGLKQQNLHFSVKQAKWICRLKTIYCLVWADTKNNVIPSGLHVP